MYQDSLFVKNVPILVKHVRILILIVHPVKMNIIEIYPPVNAI